MNTNFLNGYKSLIGFGLGVTTGLLAFFNVISPELATTLAGIAASFLGVGIAGKIEASKAASQDVAQQIEAIVSDIKARG